MKRIILICLFALVTAAAGIFVYTQIMIRAGAGTLPPKMAKMLPKKHTKATPPEMADRDQQADAILVDKSERKMTLLKDGKPIRHYRIALGDNPVGHKVQEGDERTPEGTYVIDWRNPKSIAHLSLHISYPNEEDIKRAKALGVSPGGNIMIHGILNGWGMVGAQHTRHDWTNGCIAVTNEEMEEIWSLVPNGTPITING